MKWKLDRVEEIQEHEELKRNDIFEEATKGGLRFFSVLDLGDENTFFCVFYQIDKYNWYLYN